MANAATPVTLDISIDLAGWHRPADAPANSSTWQSVTSDQLDILCFPRSPSFPDLADIAAVRRFFKTLVAGRNGGLIACDVIKLADTPAVRTIYKYPTGRAMSMSFGASLLVPVSHWSVELLIRGNEGSPTGVREALVIAGLPSGESEQRQLKEKKIPIEWRFERYEPTVQSAVCFVVSDDEQYDARFPDHPLSRVRRWARRAERTFQVSLRNSGSSTKSTEGLFSKFKSRLVSTPSDVATPESPVHLQVHPLPIIPMDLAQGNAELGVQVMADEACMLTLQRMGAPMVPLSERQKSCTQRMDAAISKMVEEDRQQRENFKTETNAILETLSPENTRMIVLRDANSGRWYTRLNKNGFASLALFTNLAFVDDFRAATSGDSGEPHELTVREIFASREELRRQDIRYVQCNPCPRCQVAITEFALDVIVDELSVLKMYATTLATRRLLSQRDLQGALQIEDPAARLQALKRIILHLNPAEQQTHLEIIKTATALGEEATADHSRAILAKYCANPIARSVRLH